MVTAIVLAAGISRRMGTPKMLLPWAGKTVIGHVVAILADSGVGDILVVTGGAAKEVEEVLGSTSARMAHNPRFTEAEMLVSLQVGLRNLPEDAEAALVVRGDQPQIERAVVMKILDTYHKTGEELIIPSYQMRRGHPWLVAESLWDEILALPANLTLRHFLEVHADGIHYLVMSTPSILQDLDTPEDYAQYIT